MPNRIKSYFLQVGHALRLRGPLAEDVRARTLHGLIVGLLLYIWIVHLPILVPLFVVRKAGSTLANLFLTLIYGITLALLRRGALRRASGFFLAGSWLAATVLILLGGGVHSTALVHYVNLPILAAWLLGASAAGVTTAVCLGISLALAVLEQSGYHLPHYFFGTPFGSWSLVAMATLGAVVPVLFVLSALNEALEKRRRAEGDLREANEKLEQRVRERTVQLENANCDLQIHLADQKRLEASLELAARLPGENPNPVMRLGHGHLVDFANPPAQELLRTLGCSVAGEAPAEIAEPAMAALRAAAPRQMERTYTGRTYLFSLVPIPQLDYVNLYATDITERKQAEEALRESESRERARSAEFEALMEAAPVGIFKSEDTECRWMSGNRAAYDLLRRPRGSNLSKSGPEDEKPVNFRAVKNGEEIPLSELPMQKAAATGQAVPDHEMDFIFEDGITVNVLGNVVPLLDESRRPRGAVGTFLDITSRKQAEKALEESELRYRELFERSASALAVYEMLYDAQGNPIDFRYVNVNRAFERVTGRIAGQILGRTALEVTPDIEKYWIKLFGQVAATGEPTSFDHYAQHLGRHYVGTAYSPRANHVAVTFMDVTERKRAEEALRASEERFRVLAEAMPQIVWSADTTGAWEYVNPQALRYGGVELEDLGGWKWTSFVHPDDLASVESAWRRALATGESDQIEHRLRRADGEFRWHLTRAVPLRNEKGELTHWIGTATDIHDQKMAARELERRVAERTAELARSTALLETVTSNAPVILFATDAQGVFTVHTGKGVTASGRKAGELVGVDYRDALSGRSQAVDNLRRALKGESFTAIIEGPAGGAFETHYAPLRDGEGNVIGTIGVSVDITERTRAERELRRLNRALRALSATDQAMVRAQDESELLRETCRILLEEGGYRFAWVGFAEQDEAKTVRPVAHAGFEEGYLETAEITWADTARGRGPTGTAIRTGRPCVSQNMLEDPRLAPWREEAGRRGYASSCALPLVVGGNPIGALTVYSARPEAFDSAEAELLMQLGADLAFGMEALHTRVERQRAEEALKAERKRFFTVLETLPPMICLLTPDYHVAFANRAFREKFGESLGRRCYEYCFGHSAPCEFCQTYNVLKTGQPCHWEVKGKDGSVIDAYDFPFTDADGSPLILEMGIDITEAKRAKDRLEKASAYNRSLLEASLDPLVTIASDGKITDVNSATEKVTGRSRQELIGTDFSDYFTQPEKARSGYQQVFKEGWVHDFELEVRHRDGPTTPVLYDASVYRDESGEVVGVFAAARDITTRKRAEEEVRRLNEELEQRVQLRTAQLEASNKELEAFTYSVSHDLRTPLRAMDGFSRILLEEYRPHLPAEAQKYLDFVRGSAGHMGKLIDGLLGLSRLGRQELNKRPVEVSEIVRQSMDDLRADWEGRGVEFIVGALPACEADPLLLRQVFVNLLSNALKFSRKQEKVRIAIGAVRASEVAPPLLAVEPRAEAPVPRAWPHLLDPDSWVYYVRDNGVGFDMRYAEKLFGVFQRLHRRADFEGTGLGLATVRQIIHKHGGETWAEGEADKGATFYFTLGPSVGETNNAQFAAAS